MKRALTAVVVFTIGIWGPMGAVPPHASAQSAYTCLLIVNDKTEPVTIKVKGYDSEWSIRPNAPTGTVLSYDGTPLHQASFTITVYWRGANITSSVSWLYDKDSTDTTVGTNRCDGMWRGTVQ